MVVWVRGILLLSGAGCPSLGCLMLRLLTGVPAGWIRAGVTRVNSLVKGSPYKLSFPVGLVVKKFCTRNFS